MQNQDFKNEFRRTGGILPKAFRRLRKISRDVAMSSIFKIFMREKKKDPLENHFVTNDKISDQNFTYDTYSRHQSIFQYNEIPPVEERKRNSSFDWNSNNQRIKLVFGSTKLTNHSNNMNDYYSRVNV